MTGESLACSYEYEKPQLASLKQHSPQNTIMHRYGSTITMIRIYIDNMMAKNYAVNYQLYSGYNIHKSCGGGFRTRLLSVNPEAFTVWYYFYYSPRHSPVYSFKCTRKHSRKNTVLGI